MTNEEQARDTESSKCNDRLMSEIRKGIIGQDEVIEQLLITLLARVIVYSQEFPDWKTLLVKTLAKCLSLGFKESSLPRSYACGCGRFGSGG